MCVCIYIYIHIHIYIKSKGCLIWLGLSWFHRLQHTIETSQFSSLKISNSDL